MYRQAEFLRLFVECEGQVRALVGALIRDRHAREDVVQEVALILWQEFQRYDATRPFGAWARGVAANKVMQRWEQEGRAPRPFSPQVVQALVDACDRAEAKSSLRAEVLEDCLKELPEKSRRLLTLRYGELLKVERIATELQGTVDGVYQALSRLRARLAECVERRLAGREAAHG
jgi:RNA polymerase sigma-70 factor (ECF subfamily)